MNQNIGEKVKELRTNSKMTLKELSEKTALSTGFLSQFERGLTTIAIDSLHKVALALDVDITFFFDTAPARRGVILKSYQQSVSQVLNSTIYRTLVGDVKGKLILPRLVEILPMESLMRACRECYEDDTGEEPGPENELETFAHGGEEFLYVLEGILTLALDGENHALYPGDSAYYNSSVPHNWANHTSRTVKFLAVNAPNEFYEDTPA